jgi:hypothetical protein
MALKDENEEPLMFEAYLQGFLKKDKECHLWIPSIYQ